LSISKEKRFRNAKKSLADMDAEILEHYEYFNRFYIRISFYKLRELASLPWVMYIDTDNKPLTTENYQAGQSHVSNVLRLENSLGGRGLTGEGVKIGINDNGMIGEHIDFDNRVTQVYQGNYGEHATHCSGTIIGAGRLNINSLGMAPKSHLYSRNNTSFTVQMLLEIQNYGIMITSNSYGYMTQSQCGQRGKYDGNSREIDKLTNDSIHFLHFFASGNDALQCINGWNTVYDGPNSSKNILTVGAIDKTDIITSFSSRGPLVDGRLKPEITSVGKSVYSTYPNNTYDFAQGTSMATPGVVGMVALLYEKFIHLNNGDKPDAALIKGIVCNTAQDLGNIGPDYIYGYGKINGLRAARLIEQGSYFSGNITQSNTHTHSITVPANVGQLGITLCWTDKEALANANPALVNSHHSQWSKCYERARSDNALIHCKIEILKAPEQCKPRAFVFTRATKEERIRHFLICLL
jgi:subtilisin family serine protease